MIKNKKILLVAFYFYPCSLIGAKRSSYLANFLSNKGMDVTILKADDVNYYNDIDYDLSLDSNIKIINVNNIIKLKSFKQSIIWYFSFKKEIKKILKNNDFDLIYFSGGPFFYFPLGYYVKKKYHKKYLLDFRDLWTLEFNTYQNWKGKLINKISRYFEKKSLVKADMVNFVTESESNFYKKFYSQIDESKFFVIRNGYDDTNKYQIMKKSKNLLIKNEKTSERQKFKLGIFGIFAYYNFEHVKILIKAIRDLKQIFDIKIFKFGEEEVQFSQSVVDAGLLENFEFIGYKEYQKGLESLSNMDFLILNNRSEFALGTKIFDYILLNKPILAFTTSKSEIWSLLLKLKNTFLIQTSKDFILAINVLSKRKDLSIVNKQNLKEYSRKFQMEKLYKNLKDLIYATNC